MPDATPRATGGGAGGSLRRVLAVAASAMREALRRKLVVAAIGMSAAFLALYGTALHFAASSLATPTQSAAEELMHRVAAAQMLYIGLLPASFIVALTAVLSSVGAISSDLDSGVAYGVLTRPIRRGEFVVGKFLGVGAMVAVFSAALQGGVILVARWQIHTVIEDWPRALLLVALEPLALVALAVLGSSRLPTLANGILCTVVYAIGFIGGLIEQVGSLIPSQTMMQIGVVSSLIMPLDAIHRMASSFVLPPGLLPTLGSANATSLSASATPSTWMAVYAVGFVVVCVALAAGVFRRRDL